jgi:hypothetical protein
MTDTALESRLSAWLDGRDPGPVPMTVRAGVARVTGETSLPLVAGIMQPLVGPRWAGRESAALRLILVLGLLALLIVSALSLLTTGRPKLPTAWRDYVVGQPVPDRDFGSVAGVLAHGDPTVSVDDFPKFVVVLYFPGDATATRVVSDARGLVSASEHSPSGTAFLVLTPAGQATLSRAIDSLTAAGMLTAHAPAEWQSPHEGDVGPALVITDRRGIVDQVYTGQLPDAAGLIGDLDRASIR